MEMRTIFWILQKWKLQAAGSAETSPKFYQRAPTEESIVLQIHENGIYNRLGFGNYNSLRRQSQGPISISSSERTQSLMSLLLTLCKNQPKQTESYLPKSNYDYSNFKF